MNKKILIVVVVLLLVVGGYFFMKGQKGGTPAGTQGTTETSSGGLKSLKDLIASGVAQKCTFSTSDTSGVSEGTTYVAGGKMRGDFTSTVSGKTTKSHMIADGKTTYIWVDGEKTGFKTTFEETATAKPEGTQVSEGTASGGGVDLNQKTDYKCSTWITDSSQFTPPADVKFTDFSQMFNPSSLPVSNPQ